MGNKAGGGDAPGTSSTSSNTDQRRHIDSRCRIGGRPLKASTHREELIKGREIVLPVSAGNGLFHVSV